ncbi:MAG: hypothetical protein Q7T32_08735 [Moraxellaceae bacterium]|nr:hypothetical protein [Moraxellaceae bacterium]
MHKIKMKALALAILLSGGIAHPVLALDDITDGELADISGQDGLSLSFTDPPAGVQANTIQWQTTPTNGLELGSAATPVNLKRIDTSRPLINAHLDAGSDGTTPWVSLNTDWANSRLDIGSIGLTGVSGSFGRYVIDAAGTFSVRNAGGILNVNSATWGAGTTINIGGVNPALWTPGTLGASTPGQIYWRQGTSELSMGDYTFFFDMTDGRIGVDNNGLLVQSKPGSKIKFALSLDFTYDATGTSPFAITGADKSMLYWGWRGHQTDFTLRLNGKGRVKDDNTGNLNGLGASLAFNYDPDFVWIIGEGGTNPFKIEFGNWTLLPGNTLAYNLPSVTLDQLDVGQGVAGLCWGQNTISATANGTCTGSGTGSAASNFAAQPIKVRAAADAKALALGVRDMTLSAYSSTVDLIDRTSNAAKAPQRYNWALIYTFANLDADIIVTPVASSDRMRLDLALTTQTLETGDTNRWQKGTNFMIGDTDTGVNQGIGLIGADVLMAVRNGTLGQTASGIKFDSPQVRYQLRGMIAGGAIPAMPVMQKMAYIDMNLEADRFVLTLGPAATGKALTYSGFINIINSNIADFSNPVPTAGNHIHDDGTYLSLSEPNFSKLGVDFRFADITGSVEVTDGKVDLQGESEGQFRLLISNNIKVGSTATHPCAFGVASCAAVVGTPLQVGRLEFGGKDLGALVMPSGIIRAQVTMMPQVP